MHEARFGTNDLGKMGEERNDVVFDLALDGVDPRDIERRVFALGPDRLRRTFRDQAELGHGVGRMGFDLEPDAKPRLRRPDFGHRGPAIARNHAVTRSEEYEFP